MFPFTVQNLYKMSFSKLKIFLKLEFLSFLLLSIVITSCRTVKPVIVQKPFDTHSKNIRLQPKKVFNLETIGVQLSNNFDGARLNNAE